MAGTYGVKAIDDLVRAVERAFGRGTLMPAAGAPVDRVDVISTGHGDLDGALGIGGLPKGRIVEVFGPQGSGKTALALAVIARAQGDGLVTAIVDTDHALDLVRCRALGIDCGRMLLSQPDCGEQALDVVEALVRSGQVGVVVVDSVRGLVPKAEIDGLGDESLVGGAAGHRARLMSRAMRKLSSLAIQSGTLIVFTGGVAGDNALRFYSSVRLLLGPGGSVKVVKNKFAPPFQECRIDLGTEG